MLQVLLNFLQEKKSLKVYKKSLDICPILLKKKAKWRKKSLCKSKIHDYKVSGILLYQFFLSTLPPISP